jgi:hypothetical protein
MMSIIFWLKKYSQVIRSNGNCLALVNDRQNLLQWDKLKISKQRHFYRSEVLGEHQFDIFYVASVTNDIFDSLFRPIGIQTGTNNKNGKNSTVNFILANNDDQLKNKILQIHNWAEYLHPGRLNMRYICTQQNAIGKNLGKLINEVCKECRICRQFKKRSLMLGKMLEISIPEGLFDDASVAIF